MADPLQERLKSLVEEWRWTARNERVGWPEAAGLLYAADRLEDVILNSPGIPDGCAAREPEPCACHTGSVCTEACAKGRCHDGCKPACK